MRPKRYGYGEVQRGEGAEGAPADDDAPWQRP